MHVDNLELCLQREGVHAPNHQPEDGLVYRPVHSVAVQASRQDWQLPVGPGGTLHDYVPFYFGPLSPMLLNLKTGRVPGYDEGQEPLIYLVARAQEVAASGTGFVFSDGHGLAAFTEWFDDLADLTRVDWKVVKARYWADSPDDMDRQRRKQAEFLVHRFMPWSLVRGVAVMNEAVRQQVESAMSAYPPALRRPVKVFRGWYY